MSLRARAINSTPWTTAVKTVRLQKLPSTASKRIFWAAPQASNVVRRRRMRLTKRAERLHLLGGPILLPLLFQRGEFAFPLGRLALAGFAARMSDHRNFLKRDGQGPGSNLGLAKQGHQQRGLQEP